VSICNRYYIITIIITTRKAPLTQTGTRNNRCACLKAQWNKI